MSSEGELDRFRREWQAEVRARDPPRPPAASASQSVAPSRTARQAPTSQRKVAEDDRVLGTGWNFDDLEGREDSRRLGESGQGVHPEAAKRKEPITALEHYERAVETEAQGKLGESVALYRRAFRLNETVDQQYKNKHFPPSAFQSQSKTAKPSVANASSTVPDPVHAPLRPGDHETTAGISGLVASFANEAIHPSLPIIERDIPPPCPIASIPIEIMTEILRFSALDDVASFVRLGSVCKRLAYLIATEARVWKEVCLDSRVGFNTLHHDFACSLQGRPIESNVLSDFHKLSMAPDTADEDEEDPAPTEPPAADPLALSPSYPTYAAMFRHRPRIRFAGVYISTVNYARPGAAAPNRLTWNNPIHIVTYYRYLRFYRDGSCISLLTTAEPLEVVPHYHVENVGESLGGLASAGLVAVAKHTLRGRWRTSPLHAFSDAEKKGSGQESEPEGNVLVEMFGPTPPLIYHMQLALRSNSGRGPKNTKLVWRGYWSYDKITDDWAEFGLRNDRPYVWSRVKSWADA